MRRIPLFCELLFLGAVLACSGDESSVSPTAGPLEGAGAAAIEAPDRHLEIEMPAPPDADFFEITQRLRLPPGESIPRVMKAPPPAQEVGWEEVFTVTDLQTFTRFQAAATLQKVTPHAYWYVDNELSVDQQALERSAKEFEDQIYPTNVLNFGDTVVGGFDGDSHLTILTARFEGAAGYYSSADEYPKVVHPYSNQRLMLYINGNVLIPGTRAFDSVIAHELQHAIHWHADPNEESWVNEGLSVLAEELNGFRPLLVRVFERSPEVQLTYWEEEPSANTLHYAAAHLFMRFLGQHWGGYERLKELVAEPKDGIAGVDAYLENLGSPDRFRDVFKAWVVANVGGNSTNSRHKYEGLQVRAEVVRKITNDVLFSDQVRQYAAKYFEVKPETGSASVSFLGDPATRLLPTEAHSGRAFWWSNRGDHINSTLTREVDLSQVTTATLHFWTWFYIEKGWDYGYVAVSEDGGTTWTILPGTYSSTEDPLGNSYGPGYTGKSGGRAEPHWVQESIDLTPYAGQKVHLRFEYITDDAVNTDGLALDDIEVPEVGFWDDAEADRDWDAQGFLRTNNLLAQDFIVQILEHRSGGAMTVQDFPLNAQQKGSVQVCCFGQDLERVVVVVAALASATTEPATFQLSVQTEP